MTKGYSLTGGFARRLQRILPRMERLAPDRRQFGEDQPSILLGTVRRFELSETLGQGGYAEAYPLKWNSTTSQYEADTTDGHEFTVYDGLNTFEGTGRSVDEGTVTNGARGYCAKMPDRGVYEIIQLSCAENE